MPGDVNIPMLPGMEEFARHVDRAGAQDLSDPKRYTAMTLLRNYPDVYRQAARALFYYRLPCRTVRDLFRLSAETVAAIRDQVLASSTGAAAFLSAQRQASQRDIVQARLLDAIEERLADPDKLNEIDTASLVAMLEKLDKSRPASNGVDDKRQPMDVNVVSPDAFDAAVDGLSAEKNPAPIGCVRSGPAIGGTVATMALGCMLAAGAICSTESTSNARYSSSMSNDSQYSRAYQDMRCNSRRNSWAMADGVAAIVEDSPATPPAATPAFETPRGRGDPRGARRAGVNHKCIVKTRGGVYAKRVL